MLIVNNWFEHNNILVMDNAEIHMASEAECVEYYLWNMVIDGRPLQVKIGYLSTRCPELNPIEFMFHLLSNHVPSFQYLIMGAINHEGVTLIRRVFDDIKYETVVKTFVYYGYFHSHPMGVD
jgi:hypothetical protein